MIEAFRKVVIAFKDEGGEYQTARQILDEVFEVSVPAEVSVAGAILRAHQEEAVKAKAKAILEQNAARAARPISDSERAARRRTEKITADARADTFSLICPGHGPWGAIAIGKLPTIAAEGTHTSAIARRLMHLVPIGTSTSKSVQDVIAAKDFDAARAQAKAVVAVEHGIEEREQEHAVQ